MKKKEKIDFNDLQNIAKLLNQIAESFSKIQSDKGYFYWGMLEDKQQLIESTLKNKIITQENIIKWEYNYFIFSYKGNVYKYILDNNIKKIEDRFFLLENFDVIRKYLQEKKPFKNTFTDKLDNKIESLLSQENNTIDDTKKAELIRHLSDYFKEINKSEYILVNGKECFIFFNQNIANKDDDVKYYTKKFLPRHQFKISENIIQNNKLEISENIIQNNKLENFLDINTQIINYRIIQNKVSILLAIDKSIPSIDVNRLQTYNQNTEQNNRKQFLESMEKATNEMIQNLVELSNNPSSNFIYTINIDSLIRMIRNDYDLNSKIKLATYDAMIKLINNTEIKHAITMVNNILNEDDIKKEIEKKVNAKKDDPSFNYKDYKYRLYNEVELHFVDTKINFDQIKKIISDISTINPEINKFSIRLLESTQDNKVEKSSNIQEKPKTKKDVICDFVKSLMLERKTIKEFSIEYNDKEQYTITPIKHEVVELDKNNHSIAPLQKIVMIQDEKNNILIYDGVKKITKISAHQLKKKQQKETECKIF